MQRIYIKGYEPMNFPDEMSQPEIKIVIDKMIAGKVGVQEPVKPPSMLETAGSAAMSGITSPAARAFASGAVLGADRPINALASSAGTYFNQPNDANKKSFPQLMSENMAQEKNNDAQRAQGDPVGTIAGNVLSYLTPGSGAHALFMLGAKAAGLIKGASTVAKIGRLATAGAGGVGAAEGTHSLLNAPTSISNPMTYAHTIADVVPQAAIAGAIGPAQMGIGKIVGPALAQITKTPLEAMQKYGGAVRELLDAIGKAKIGAVPITGPLAPPVNAAAIRAASRQEGNIAANILSTASQPIPEKAAADAAAKGIYSLVNIDKTRNLMQAIVDRGAKAPSEEATVKAAEMWLKKYVPTGTTSVFQMKPSPKGMDPHAQADAFMADLTDEDQITNAFREWATREPVTKSSTPTPKVNATEPTPPSAPVVIPEAINPSGTVEQQIAYARNHLPPGVTIDEFNADVAAYEKNIERHNKAWEQYRQDKVENPRAAAGNANVDDMLMPGYDFEDKYGIVNPPKETNILSDAEMPVKSKSASTPAKANFDLITETPDISTQLAIELKKTLQEEGKAAYNNAAAPAYLRLLTQAARETRFAIERAAQSSGRQDYVDNMRILAQKMGAISAIKRSLGNAIDVQPAVAQRLVETINAVNKTAKLFSSRLAVFDKQFGTDFVNQAKFAHTARQLGPKGSPRLLPEINHALAPALIAGVAGTGYYRTKDPHWLALAALTSPRLATEAIGVAGTPAAQKIIPILASQIARYVNQTTTQPTIGSINKKR